MDETSNFLLELIIENQLINLDNLDNISNNLDELLVIFLEERLILFEFYKTFIILLAVIFGLILGSLFIKVMFKD